MMRRLFILALFSGSLIACKKETCDDGIQNQDEVQADCGGECAPCDIVFPNSGSYGTNLINADSVSFVQDGTYSLRAEIPEGSTFKAIIHNVSGGTWFWAFGTNSNCVISDLTSSQTFEALESGIMQVQIQLGGPGTALIQYFENSSSETKTKSISWS